MCIRAVLLSLSLLGTGTTLAAPPAEPVAPTAGSAEAPAAAAASAAVAPASEPAVAPGSAAVAAASADDGEGGMAPLPPEVAAAFAALREDPPPPQIVRSSHYWISNEYRHDLVRATLAGPDGAGVGGILLGVGTDQNYLMAAWARSEVLVLMDFDTAIPRLHRVYGQAFKTAATPEAFLAFWGDDQVKANLAWIRATWGEEKEGDRMAQAFRTAQPLVRRRLTKTLRDYRKRGQSTFLDDPAQYRHLRDLWRAGRVFALRGDLTAEQTVVDIGAAARKAGLPVRVVYMSNAPQYFDFDARFRANMAALPMDERSWFVHTLTRGAYGYADGFYHYNVQPGPNFQKWMAEATRLKKLTQILKHRTVTATEGFSVMEKTPAEVGL